MIVAFSIGKNSAKAISTLKTLADNIDFYSYDSIQAMIKEATLRHISFDRIVFSDSIVKDPAKDLPALNEFIKNYSDSTEVVMISRHTGSDKVFSKMFNSPMYTPVLMETSTASTILELVKDDILSLRTKYYVLDVDSKDNTIVSSVESEAQVVQKKDVPPSNKEHEKKGILGGIMGIFRKNSKNSENISSNKSGIETVESSGETSVNVDSGLSADPASLFTEFMGVEGIDSESSENNSLKNSIFSESMSGLGGLDNYQAENSESAAEDVELSIGFYGSQHSDTGFLDEDGEEELQRYVEQQRSMEDSIDDSAETENGDSEDENNLAASEEYYIGDNQSDSSDVEDISEQGQIGDEENNEQERSHGFSEPIKTDGSMPNMDIVFGVKGSGVTQAIVDEAVRMVNQYGIKVLIVDLDTNENGILSYIDTNRFYIEGAYEGISKHRVYEEDGIGVVSNGYGVPVSTKSLFSFINGRIPIMYDMVFIDCPIECIGSVGIDLLKKFHMLLMSGDDLSDLLATSLALTNRDNLDIASEKYIMGNCSIEFNSENGECSPEFLDVARDMCLFANGSWLDRL